MANGMPRTARAQQEEDRTRAEEPYGSVDAAAALGTRT